MITLQEAFEWMSQASESLHGWREAGHGAAGPEHRRAPSSISSTSSHPFAPKGAQKGSVVLTVASFNAQSRAWAISAAVNYGACRKPHPRTLRVWFMVSVRQEPGPWPPRSTSGRSAGTTKGTPADSRRATACPATVNSSARAGSSSFADKASRGSVRPSRWSSSDGKFTDSHLV